MIITPHLLIGAAIGAKIEHFGWIIILGLISHFVLDKIPHWDYGKTLEKIPRDKYFKKNLFIEFLKMGVDGFIGLVIIISIIWYRDVMAPSYLPFILVGILASLFPDLVLGIIKLFYHKFKFSKNYIDIHDKFFHYPKHIKKLTPLGVSTQILICIIAISILTFS